MFQIASVATSPPPVVGACHEGNPLLRVSTSPLFPRPNTVPTLSAVEYAISPGPDQVGSLDIFTAEVGACHEGNPERRVSTSSSLPRPNLAPVLSAVAYTISPSASQIVSVAIGMLVSTGFHSGFSVVPFHPNTLLLIGD